MSVVNVTWTKDEEAYIATLDNSVLFTLNGVTSTDGIQVSQENGKYVVTLTKTSSIAEAGTTDVSVSIDNGTTTATLKIGGNINARTTTEKWRNFEDGSVSYALTKGTGYEIVDNEIVYANESETENLFTLNGITQAFAETLTGKSLTKDSDGKYTVTITKSAISTESVDSEDVSITLDIDDEDNVKATLALGEDLNVPKQETVGWGKVDTEGHNVAYKAAGIGAGYELRENGKEIGYKEDARNDLFTLNGITSTDGIEVSQENGKYVVTLTKTSSILKAGTTEVSVSVNNGTSTATLKIGGNLEEVKSYDATWSVNNGTATYKGG